MRAVLVLAIAVATVPAGRPPRTAAITAPAVREFRVDAGHSDVAFSIGFLGHPVRGRFSDIKGTIVYAPRSPAAWAVTVVIGVRSINTGSTHRDDHLRSADFFDADRFPSIVFSSTRVAATGKGFVATGSLAMHGVTRAVTIPFTETTPPIEDPHGSTLVVFSGALRIARKDFGIVGGSKYNDWFDTIRSATMSDSVDIILDVTGWDYDFGRLKTYEAAVEKLVKEGVGPTVARMRSLHAQHPDSLRNAEWEFEQVARAMLYRERTDDAIELFRLSAEIFPRSAAAHAALARAYEVAGKLPQARASVAQALAIDTLDTRAIEIRRRVVTGTR